MAKRLVTDIEKLAMLLRAKGYHTQNPKDVARLIGVEYTKDVRRALQKALAMAAMSSSYANPTAQAASHRQTRILRAKHGKGEARANPNVSNLTRYAKPKRDKAGNEEFTPVDYSHLPVNRQAGVNNELNPAQFERDGERNAGPYAGMTAERRRV